MAELLIANSSRGKVEKGDIWEIRANNAPVGIKEAVEFVILKIPNQIFFYLITYLPELTPCNKYIRLYLIASM